jgi:hypothetical protein
MASPHRVEVIGEATAGRAEGVARAVAGALADGRPERERADVLVVASVDGRSNRPPEVAPCHRTDWRFVHIKPDALRATGAPAAQARDLQPLRLMRSARQARLRHKQYVRDLQPQVNAAQDAAQDAARLLESRTTGESRTTSREARRAAGRTERRGARAPSVAAPSRSPLPQPQICGTTAVGRTTAVER